MFTFGLNQFVEISISGEMGHVKGRAEYADHANGYQVHYKAADGRAEEKWFDEDELTAVEDDDDGGPVFVVKKNKLPADVTTE
ncbi:hypothetical protein GTU79_21200 [Sodalis ligni]|uniref:hypothetical protein n=1 Tax=Sodalis ligni TaxID=2697027 RepID=UPI00193F6FB8|nr:hypothetical protein [Sodalis ligni]QWA09803.1 hypothetical protein GTU79_21200 [Sodalis ligni]